MHQKHPPANVAIATSSDADIVDLAVASLRPAAEAITTVIKATDADTMHHVCRGDAPNLCIEWIFLPPYLLYPTLRGRVSCIGSRRSCEVPEQRRPERDPIEHEGQHTDTFDNSEECSDTRVCADTRKQDH